MKKHRLSEKTYKRIRKENKINLALAFKGSSLASAYVEDTMNTIIDNYCKLFLKPTNYKP